MNVGKDSKVNKYMLEKSSKIWLWISLTVLTFILSVRVDSRISLVSLTIGVGLAACIWGWMIFHKKYAFSVGEKDIFTVMALIGSIIWLRCDLEFFLSKSLVFNIIHIDRILYVRIMALILFVVAFYGAFVLINSLVRTVADGIRYFIKTSDKIEIVYLILWSVLCAVVVFAVYSSTVVFYSPGKYNLLYTFDSNSIYNANSFMLIGQKENDIRQSLFGFFALPVSIPSYFLSIIFPFQYAYAYFVQVLQDVLIGVGFILIVRLIGLKKGRKIVALCSFSVMSSTWIFSLLIEQYIILVFWLIVSVYCISNKIGNREFCAVAAVGTAPTNALALIWEIKNQKSLKDFVVYGVRSFAKYIMVMICLGQTGLVLSSYNNVASLMNYSGNIDLVNRLKQYLFFVRSCFIGPASTVTEWDAWEGGPVLRMNEVLGYSRVGIILLILIFACWLISNKGVYSNICLTWVVFSLVLMVGMGYCAATNDMFLFSYYFGWSFASLLLIGMDKIIKKKYVFESIVLTGILVMLIYNIPYLIRVLDFAITYYPLQM